MSVPPADPFAEQRVLVKRAAAQGRRWILRGVLLAVVGVLAVSRAGSVNTAIGLTCLGLSFLAITLGAQTRRKARDLALKITLMQQGKGAT